MSKTRTVSPAQFTREGCKVVESRQRDANGETTELEIILSCGSVEPIRLTLSELEDAADV